MVTYCALCAISVVLINLFYESFHESLQSHEPSDFDPLCLITLVLKTKYNSPGCYVLTVKKGT